MRENADLSARILFTDEAKFYVRDVNCQNLRYWNNVNTHWGTPTKILSAIKLYKVSSKVDSKVSSSKVYRI